MGAAQFHCSSGSITVCVNGYAAVSEAGDAMDARGEDR
jgi:hypothetical protein